MRKLIAVILMAFILTGCVSQPVPVPDPPSGETQPPAPLFTLEDLDGETWSLEELKGEVVVLYFWTGSCPYCLGKLPELSTLQEQLPKDINLLLLNGGDSKTRVQKLVADYPNLTVLMNASDVFAPCGVRSVPTTIFIDRDGLFDQGYIGPMPNQSILDIIADLS